MTLLSGDCGGGSWRRGAVGRLVVQLAHEAGARVIGSGRTDHKDTVLDLGASTFLDLQQDRLEEVGEVDVVFDVIGGEVLRRSARLMRPGGALITIAEPPQVQPEHGRAIFFVVEPDRAGLVALEHRLRDGRLRPIVGAVCSLAEAPSAFGPGRRTRGKTVVAIADAN